MTTYLPTVIGILGLSACNLTPRVSDIPIDAAPMSDVLGATNILPPGSIVPSISENSELLTQIRLNDGLSDSVLAANGNVIVRGTGKSGGGMPVRYWSFGPSPVDNNFAVMAPLYVFGTLDTSAVFTPLTDHPPMIDTICGDIRYSPIRRVIDVPVTDKYTGQRITTVAALSEAIDLGLVGDPVPDGTWVNMPVVLPGVTLEIGAAGTYQPMPSQQVYGRGYLVNVFELGTSLGRQPLKNNAIPIGQASGLQSGVTMGVPPVLSTAIDPQPVFQYTIPTVAPPANTPSYTPLATDVTVRLANGIAPSVITNDTDLFKRTNGAITGYLVDNVASFTINTTTNDLQLQFAEGSP